MPDKESKSGKTISLEVNILQKNDDLARLNREYFKSRNITAFNLLGSPGSGKTTFMVNTVKKLRNKIDFYIIEGDQQSEHDAQLIKDTGVCAVRVNTGDECHLDSKMIWDALKIMDIKEGGVLLIENVGNLVCPTMFDLGESKRVVIISVTEGEEKPLKYPKMFMTADICIISKTDLLPFIRFDLELFKKNARKINPNIIFFEWNNVGNECGWFDWLEGTNS